MSFLMWDVTPLEVDRLPTDQELVVRARSGDSAAFEQLFGRFHERICIYLAYIVGNDAIGQELTQETFLRAWQSLPGFRDETRFTGWLYRIATNIARDYQRRAKRIHWLPWERLSLQGRLEEVSIAGPEEQVAETELLDSAFAQVSLTYRACLVLYIVEDLPQAQIAERLGIKATYVSNYVSRGLVELRRNYLRLSDEHGIPAERRLQR
jgi:RNA polymerase sigma-70 factor (ECF subfamily)